MYRQLMYVHLATVVPCIFLGAAAFLMPKGTTAHRTIGRLYMILMMITACVTLFMPALVGPRLLNHFGWIHLFSVLTIWSVPTAWLSIRRGDVNKHKWTMICLYLGAIMIAGGFTLVPGRYLHSLLF